MPVPELPPFDAKAANNAWKTLRKPDGTEFQVFGSESFVKFVQGLRTLQDYTEGNDVRIVDLDNRVKALDSSTDNRLKNLAQRVAALEALPQRPFPASG